MIVKTGNEYELVSRKGKNLGKYPSREGALKRERQVEYFKHLKETQMTRISFKDFIKESEQIDENTKHLIVAVKYNSPNDPNKEDVFHMLDGVTDHNGDLHDHPTEGPRFKFKNADSAKKFVSHTNKAPNKTITTSTIKESEQIDELSSDTLANYKKRAAAEATRLDKQRASGVLDKPTSKVFLDKANKRFSGIIKATNKQFANESEQIDESDSQHELDAKKHLKLALDNFGDARAHRTHMENYETSMNAIKKINAERAIHALVNSDAYKKLSKESVNYKKNESEQLDETNWQAFGSAGKIHPDLASHMEVGQDTNFWQPKTGNKSWGNVKHKSPSAIHIQADKEDGGKLHKFKISTQLHEESEQIDELSKAKLRNYVIANSINLTSLGRKAGVDLANDRNDSHGANEKKIHKHTTGMVKAAWRLAKESVELDEAGFDWSSAARGKLQQIGEPKSNTGVHKARSYGAQDPVIDDGEKPVKPAKQSADKKSVGRPAGTYGSYKIDKASRDDPDYKKQLSQKVMAAKAENFQIRKEFKDLMNAALKKKQAEAFQE